MDGLTLEREVLREFAAGGRRQFWRTHGRGPAAKGIRKG
jgi:hypothetical protein